MIIRASHLSEEALFDCYYAARRGETLDPHRGPLWLGPKWTAGGLLARVQQGCARLRPLMSHGRGRTPRRCVAAASTKLPLA